MSSMPDCHPANHSLAQPAQPSRGTESLSQGISLLLMRSVFNIIIIFITILLTISIITITIILTINFYLIILLQEIYQYCTKEQLTNTKPTADTNISTSFTKVADDSDVESVPDEDPLAGISDIFEKPQPVRLWFNKKPDQKVCPKIILCLLNWLKYIIAYQYGKSTSLSVYHNFFLQFTI